MAKETPIPLRVAASARRTRSSSRESVPKAASAKVIRRPSGLRTSHRLRIPDTDGSNDTEDEDSTIELTPEIGSLRSSKSKTMTMKEVSVPATNFKKPVRPAGRASFDTPSGTSSVNDSILDSSSDRYDTPDTSFAVTPAGSSIDPRSASSSTRPKSARLGNSSYVKLTTQGYSQSTYSPAESSNTRKRKAGNDYLSDIENEEEAADYRLAKRLQEEEYERLETEEDEPRTREDMYNLEDFDSEDPKHNEDTEDEDSDSSFTSFKPGRRGVKNPSSRSKKGKELVGKVKEPAIRGKQVAKRAKAVVVIDSEDDDELSDLPTDEVDEFVGELATRVSQSAGQTMAVKYLESDEDDELSDLAFDVNSDLSETEITDDTGDGVEISAGYLTARMRKERKKLEKAHGEIKHMWTDLSDIPRIIPVKDPQPSSITRKLKPFQLEGLNWMKRQEESCWKGGLLGDEMGMGKTIQAVSLIMSDYPAPAPTLVVVPPVALMQWQSEIKEYTDGKLKVLLYHGSNAKSKSMRAKELKKFNVIMISYSGLESLYRKQTKGWFREDGIVKEDSVIHAIHFHRLILDEAHNIKTRTTGVAKACFALKANWKWCLSGTPVQNRIGEFFSLLRFLEVRPFACYFCKVCDCNELHWSQDAAKKCTQCGHRGFDHVSVFNQELLNPITSDYELERRAGLEKLRLITDRIMLRRVKRDYTASMELPPKEVIVHSEFFGPIERDFSTSIMSNTSRKFDTYVSQGVMLNNYANIFGLIMQMRQVANHPDLILKKHAEGGQNVLVCCVCGGAAEEAVKSRCNHEFCRTCVKEYMGSFEGAGDNPDCPRCHIPLAIDLNQPDIEQDEDNVKKSSIINRIKMENWTSSTKIEMLVYDLYKLRSKKQTHKSIVFSQFTSMLQLIEWRLRRAGFKTVMLDGTMTPAQRQKSIDFFMNNVEVEVFLVSLKAGGVALNLTEADRVFIVDPWWNPAAEWQSADRCHRIGQRRPVVITRLCIEDSVESRMVMLQEKKANMINGTINNDQVAIDKLTPEDMQFLFRGS